MGTILLPFLIYAGRPPLDFEASLEGIQALLLLSKNKRYAEILLAPIIMTHLSGGNCPLSPLPLVQAAVSLWSVRTDRWSGAMTVQVPRSGNQERAAGGARIDYYPAHRSSSSLTWCTCTTGAADVIAYKTRAPAPPVASFKSVKTSDSS